jgi:hypothetical protein
VPRMPSFAKGDWICFAEVIRMLHRLWHAPTTNEIVFSDQATRVVGLPTSNKIESGWRLQYTVSAVSVPGYGVRPTTGWLS